MIEGIEAVAGVQGPLWVELNLNFDLAIILFKSWKIEN